MLDRLPRHRRNLALAIIAIGVGVFAWKIRSVLNPLFVGYLAAYIALPFVRRIEQLGFSRRTAVNLTFFIGGLLVTGIATFMAFQSVELASAVKDEFLKASLGDRLAKAYLDSNLWLDETFGIEILPASFADQLRSVDSRILQDRAQDFLTRYGSGIMEAGQAGIKAAGGLLGFLSRLVSRVLEVSAWVFLVPLYAYYFLFELQRLHAFVRRYFPKRDRQQIADVGAKIGGVISNFFRGRLSVCAVKGLILSLGLALAGIPYAFLFGMTSGFLSLLPFFGPVLGWAACALIALGLGTPLGGVLPSDNIMLAVLVRTGLVFGIAELIEGYVLVPKILGESLGLHPLVVLFAMFAGGAAFGLLGIVIALPVTASIVIVFQEFVLPALRKWADGEEDYIPG